MWLLVALISYFINAGVYVADKFLLSKKVHSSITYAFYVGIWSVFNFFLLFLDPWMPSLREFTVDILAGMLFLLTLIFWYKALHQSEATRVVPIVGALIPIFSFIFSYVFLDQALSERQFLAFIILVIGGVLISVRRTRFYKLKEVGERFKSIFGDLLGGIHATYRPTRRLLFNSLVAALFFASYYVLIKHIYMHQPFIGGFVWSRLGSFLGVLAILFVPAWRRNIAAYRKQSSKPANWGFFLAVRVAAALAFIMLNWAISLGNVALINALQGTQYLFLILIVVFLSSRYPKIMKEQFRGGVMLQKVLGTTLVVLGLYMLVT
jgi:drug/metabolite transporter (DMT)-like permease